MFFLLAFLTKGGDSHLQKKYSLAVYDYQNKKLIDLSSYNISIQGEVYNIKYHKETNGYKSLSFQVPATIYDDKGQIIDNFRLDYLKNEFVVRLEIEDTNNEDDKKNNFIIKSVQKQRDNSGVVSYEVECVYRLFERLSKSGMSLYFGEETGTADELLVKILKGSDWSIGEVDEFIDDDSEEVKVRTLKGERSNRFALIQEVCTLFECFPIFHEDTKTVDLKADIGLDRGVQFRYRKNLKNITQNLESNEIVTKLWVEGGDNPDEGLTLIEADNPTGENYILNFQYYKDLGLLTTAQSIAITQFESDIATINGQMNSLLDTINNKMLDKAYKESEKEGKDIARISKEQTIEELNQKISVEKNSTVKNQLISQRNILQAEVLSLMTSISTLDNQINTLESEIEQAGDNLELKLEEKDALIKDFELELGDFIKEGFYQDSNYVDSTALYKDSQKISQKMGYPRVSYQCNVLDLSKLTGYSLEEFDIGDKVYLVDETLKLNTFGRITEIDEILDSPQDTDIVISNYDTKVEDLLSRIITASTIINSRKEIYDRAQGFNADGTLNYDLLQKTFDNNLFQVKFGTNNKVIQDHLGITIIDIVDDNKYVRINAGGIFITSDGGQTWKQAVSADGISALNIVSGMIDTKQLQIWNSDQPKFFWDDEGLFAYGDNDGQWIKFGQDGLYFTRDDGQTFDLVLNWAGLMIGNKTAQEIQDAIDQAAANTNNIIEITANLEGVTTRISSVENNMTNITPHHIILSNENQSIITDSTGKVTQAVTITTDVDVFKGVNRMAGTIGTPLLKNSAGETISFGVITKSDPATGASGKVTWSIPADTNISSDSGYIEIPITIEGKAYTKKLNWTKAREGAKGDKGDQGEQGIPGVKGDKGDPGVTYYTWIKYADSPTSGMSDDPTNKTYIGIAYNKTSPTKSTNYSDYSWSLIKGADGAPGPKGADGQTLYTWIKYADDASGGGMSDDPSGKTYIGLAHNKPTATESTNADDYTWSLIKGDKGDKGTDARIVSITPSQLYFVKKLVSDNYLVTPDTITLTPDFQNCAFSKWEYSTNGTTFTQITRTSSSSTLPYYNATSMVLTVPKGWVALEDNDYVVLKITSTTGESDVQTISVLYDVTELETRVNIAEQKITPTAIVSTVRQSTVYQNDLDGKVSKNNIISEINQSAEEVQINANRLKIGTGTTYEEGVIYTWEQYIGMTWNEVIA